MTDLLPERAAGQAITELLAGFIQELRQAGLPVSLTENLDAMEAVKHIPLEDREAFKYALAATLVKNNTHWRAFETVFEVYFSLRGSQFRMGDGDDDSLADQVARIVRSIRQLELKKSPSVSETLDWARTLVLLGVKDVDADQAKETLHILLKYQSDIAKATKELSVNGS